MWLEFFGTIIDLFSDYVDTMAYAVTYLQDSECADWTKNLVFYSTWKKTLYYIIFFYNGIGQAIKLSLSSFFTSKYTVFTRILKEECNEITAHKTVDGSDSKI